MTHIPLRQNVKRGLLAAGASVLGFICRLAPEAQAISRSPLNSPWWATEPVQQSELAGADKQRALADMLTAPDVRNVLGRNQIDAIDQQNVIVVRNQRTDGRVMYSGGLPLQGGRVIGVYILEGEDNACAAVMHETRQRSGGGEVELGRLLAYSSGGALAPAPTYSPELLVNCFPGTHPCTICDDVDWGGVLECCGWCAFTPTPLCAIAWCYACYIRHCRRSHVGCCVN
jgi:hypothetical protein